MSNGVGIYELYTITFRNINVSYTYWHHTKNVLRRYYTVFLINVTRRIIFSDLFQACLFKFHFRTRDATVIFTIAELS